MAHLLTSLGKLVLEIQIRFISIWILENKEESTIVHDTLK
jgi:hypothetical protein